RSSIRADAGRLDEAAPALDLLAHELREVFRAAPLGRDDLEAENPQALAQRGIFEHVVHRAVQPAHDRLGRSLRQEERVPDAGFDAPGALPPPPPALAPRPP